MQQPVKGAIYGLCLMAMPALAQDFEALPQTGGEPRGVEVESLDIEALFTEADQLVMQEQMLQRQVNIAKLRDQLAELEAKQRQRERGESAHAIAREGAGYTVPALGGEVVQPQGGETLVRRGAWEVRVVAGDAALLRSASTGRTVSVRQGSRLPDGMVVKRISTTGVVIEHDGRERQLTLPYAMN